MIYSLLFDFIFIVGLAALAVAYYKIFLSSKHEQGGVARDA